MQMGKVSAALARLARRARPLRLGPDGPDDGRRHGLLRDARGRHARRAEGAHRLRRPARHRADDPPDAARGLPAAEFLQDHGFVDIVVPRAEMRATVARVLRLLQRLMVRLGRRSFGFLEGDGPGLSTSSLSGLAWLDALGPQRIRPGLARTRALLASLGNPQSVLLLDPHRRDEREGLDRRDGLRDPHGRGRAVRALHVAAPRLA